jgi:methylmalonyl-CoA mutase cobalamin-binding domain/chain
MTGPAHRGRVLVSKLGLDGHDVGAKVVARVLRDAGFEVVYLGIRQTPEAVAAVARDEDVDLIGVSLLSGAHLALITRLLAALAEMSVTSPVAIGGVIPEPDRVTLLGAGVGAVLDAQASSADIVSVVSRLIEERVR